MSSAVPREGSSMRGSSAASSISISKSIVDVWLGKQNQARWNTWLVVCEDYVGEAKEQAEKVLRVGWSCASRSSVLLGVRRARCQWFSYVSVNITVVDI